MINTHTCFLSAKNIVVCPFVFILLKKEKALKMNYKVIEKHSDICLIGAGIMSATLAILIKKLMPESKISVYEQLESAARESSNAWNNAGTGHSAFCELNYTPQKKDGSISIEKAIDIAKKFEISKHFWTYLTANKILPKEANYLNQVPHITFVSGQTDIDYLKKRYEALVMHPLFSEMQFSEDNATIAEWIPLMMQNRSCEERVAATKIDKGTDVNFGAITNGILDFLVKDTTVNIGYKKKVFGLKKIADGPWRIKIKDLETGELFIEYSKFVFIGAGGHALTLLQKSRVKEARGYGGFPVSGLFLKCKDEKITEQHRAKVYGKALDNEPPMSVPHLDSRIINGKRYLIFGPYAGMSPKYLKSGSNWDWPLSFRVHNIWPMLMAGWHNFSLISYLVNQVLQSRKAMIETLKQYYPNAKQEDWTLYKAGQRVQIMKKDKEKGGELKLGTEIIHTSDRSLAALLGASPGASTAVSAMLEVLEKCFPDKIATKEWKGILSEMINIDTK